MSLFAPRLTECWCQSATVKSSICEDRGREGLSRKDCRWHLEGRVNTVMVVIVDMPVYGFDHLTSLHLADDFFPDRFGYPSAHLTTLLALIVSDCCLILWGSDHRQNPLIRRFSIASAHLLHRLRLRFGEKRV